MLPHVQFRAPVQCHNNLDVQKHVPPGAAVAALHRPPFDFGLPLAISRRRKIS